MALDVHNQDPLADNHSSSPVSSTTSHLISSIQVVGGGGGGVDVDVDGGTSSRTSNASTCSAAGLVTLDLLNSNTSSCSSFASNSLNTKSSSTSNSFSNLAKNQSFDFLKPKPKVIHKPPELHQASNQSKINPSKSKQHQRKKRTLEDIIIMSQRRNMSINISPKLDLRLNLSPPRPVPAGPAAAGRLAGAQPMMIPAGGHPSDSPNRSSSGSPPSSCVSSDEMSGGTGYNYQDDYDQKYMSSPEATSMVLVGCPRCLMYVMLSEDDPRCPKCKSSVLLDFLNDMNNNNLSSGGNVFNNSYNYNAAAANISGTGYAAASGASKKTRRN